MTLRRLCYLALIVIPDAGFVVLALAGPRGPSHWWLVPLLLASFVGAVLLLGPIRSGD